MQRAGHAAVALEFADVADIHQQNAGVVPELDRFLRGYGLDLLFSLAHSCLTVFFSLSAIANPPRPFY